MTTGIWPHDTSMRRTTDRPAGLRDDGDARVRVGRHARRTSPRGPRPEPRAATAPAPPTAPDEVIPPAEIIPADEATARAEARARVRASARAEAMVRAEVMARTEAGTPARTTGRAVIGDELRIPIIWCELDGCISRHSDPAALGEADILARAVAAGWRVDALSRPVCPRCQQSNGRFWATHPVALHDRAPRVTLAEDAAGAGDRVGSRREPGGRPAARPVAGSGTAMAAGSAAPPVLAR
jgi:hypothetical protein